ncbi:hypothetical protein Desku_2641 [Desulfofundulus kuznetsovii DSM 6115]|uniref:Uncharacterized protein n=1 Tax=Desulfofundulus kuznetsovii (strain DSM 6115 / VKM B-1805 / 17) TaxID=760568 RepID=A0AAU8PRX1_DESK7|nr:hypothetical protein Desku_2641 [Desulfofundulus kuznetsovii DSM 6115]
MTRKILPFVFIILVISAYFYYIYSIHRDPFYIHIHRDLSNNNKVIMGEEKGIYCMTPSRYVFYISGKDYKILNKVRVNGGWNMAPARDGKIYVAIRGNLSKAGKAVAVLQNGKIIKYIELKNPLPRIVKYNDYNGKAYVGHIFFMNKNFITVFNTENDIVERYLPYNGEIEDISFAKDNKMIISSWMPDKDKYKDKIDVIDLDNYSLIRSIPLNFKASSIEVIGDAIYLINGLSGDPFIYAVEWKKNDSTMIKKIKLSDNYPWRLYKNEIGGKTYLYVTHYNIDNMSGQSISLIDPDQNKVIKVIHNAYHPGDIAFNNNEIVVCDHVNERLLVLRDSKIVHEIKLGERPIFIAKAK